jgi:hypothetical protein
MSTEAEVRAIHEKQIERAQADDRRWFNRNQGREFRVRDYIPFELNEAIEAPPLGMTWRTLVRRLPAGVRVRHAVAVPVFLENEDADDAALVMIFNKVVPRKLRDGLEAVRPELAALDSQVRV